MRSTLLRILAVSFLLAGAAGAAGPTVIKAPPSGVDELAAMYKDPPLDYRIQFLLRTNDEVSKEDIDWQVRSIREQGGGGVFSYCEHLDDGSPEKFLTDWWWKVVDLTASACAREKIQYWAYDEEDWPSGTAGGLLLKKNPDLTWKYLKQDKHRFDGPKTIDMPVGDDPFVAAVAFRAKVSFILPESLTDISDKVSDGRLRWEVPSGSWTVAIYTAGTGNIWNNAPYPDLMSRKVGEEWVDLVYRSHDERVKQLPGAKLVGFFCDEPSMSIANYPAGKLTPWHPAMPYSPDVPEAFRKHHGYEWRRNLPMLFHDAGPKTLQFRCHHWQTCNRLYCDNYFGQMYRFCDERGQVASTHVHVEESLMAHLTLQGGNLPAIYRNMHIPGIDWIYPFQNALPSHTPRCASSMAHLLGRPRTWCESFAACGWGLTFQQICRLVNWEHVNGINMQIPICYKYSLRGRKRTQFYNPGISYQQPYWDHFRAFADYEARLCLLASGLGHVAQVALVYPEADLWAHCWHLDLINTRSVAYFQLGDEIRQAGYDYDVFDAEALSEKTKVSGGSLVSPTEQFQILVIPQVDMISRSTLARAAELAADGGTVIFVGGLARHSIEEGADDKEVAKMLRGLLGEACYTDSQEGKPFWAKRDKGRVGFSPTPQAVPAMLREAVAPDLAAAADSDGLCSYHRRLDGGDLYLLLNRKAERRIVTFTLSVPGRPEKWNPLTGRVESIANYEITPQGTRITMRMTADEMTPIVIRPAGAADLKRPDPEVVLKEVPIPGPFRFRIEQTMSRPRVSWNFTQKAEGWTLATSQPAYLPGEQPASIPDRLPAGDWCEHGLGNFSGLGHYETEFSLDAVPAGGRVILDLGKVAVSAEVRVNGKSAGIVFMDPFQIDLTDLAKAGTNHVQITVANTLANYYSQFKELADAQIWNGGTKPEDKVSGLIGPVAVRVVKGGS